MKKPLFYSLRRKHDGNFDVIAVTTLKPKRWHGSLEPYHETTHGLNSDLLGKFETEAAARGVVANVKAAHDNMEPVIKDLEKKLREVRQLQVAEVQNVLTKAGALKVYG